MVLPLLNFFRRSYDPGKPGRRARDIGHVIAEAVENQWPGVFERVHDLVWTSEPENHIRRVFSFEATKGARFSASWGVSMDFVPLDGRKGLRWKRTTKTAAPDLIIDPIDLAGSFPDWCSIYGNDQDRWIRKAARASLAAAKTDWGQTCVAR